MRLIRRCYIHICNLGKKLSLAVWRMNDSEPEESKARGKETGHNALTVIPAKRKGRIGIG